MLKEIANYGNKFGGVTIYDEQVCFTVEYQRMETPGRYRCRIWNMTDRATANRVYNRYVGVLKGLATRQQRSKKR